MTENLIVFLTDRIFYCIIDVVILTFNEVTNMNLLKRISIPLIAILLLLSACGEAPQETTPPTESVDLNTVYLDAIAQINQTPNYQLEITTKATIAVGSEIYDESYFQTVTIENHGGNDLRIATTENITIGDTTIKYNTTLANEIGYIDIDGTKLQSPYNSPEFFENYAPAALLNFGLYKQVEGQKTENGYNYTFNDPYDIESWIGSENAKLTNASGSAELDAQGKLVCSEYTVTYADELRTVNSTTSVKVVYDNITPITIPDTQEYRPIGSILAPIYLEKAYAYISATKNLESNGTSQIQSDAFDLRRQQITELVISGTEDSFSGEIVTSIEQAGSSGEVSADLQKHIFKNGVYTHVADSVFTTQTDLTKQQYLDYCKSILVGNILSVPLIDSADITQSENYILINFTTTTAMTDAVCTNISQYLYGDNDFIAAISDEVTPASAHCYLALNKKTGLPTAYGIAFDTQHKINEADHTIHYRVDTNYYLGALQGNTAPTEAETITPMLYKVSDKNGSALWILAASQYGDDRTGNLAQPIYDALTQSTVVLTDFKQNAQYNTATNDAIDWDTVDPQLQADAKRLLTVSGSLNDKSLDLAPAYWFEPVTDHIVQQQYRLSKKLNLYNSILSYAAPTQKKVESLLPDCSAAYDLSRLSKEEQLKIWTSLLAQPTLAEEEQFIKYEALISGDTSVLTPDQVYAETCTDLTEALMKYIGTEDTAFAVIDVQYLFTEYGVLSRLQSEGYNVTQVQ